MAREYKKRKFSRFCCKINDLFKTYLLHKNPASIRAASFKSAVPKLATENFLHL